MPSDCWLVPYPASGYAAINLTTGSQAMSPSQPHYLPLTLPFFSILAAVFLLVVVVLELGALRFTFMRIGLSSRGAMLVLLGSLVGSYFNIPVAELPGQRIMSGEEINYFGMSYVVPVVVNWPGTVIAINVGGALIPTIMSMYLFVRYQLWMQGALAIVFVGTLCHLLAHPVYGVGIALPVFVPSVAAAIVALLLSRWYAAPLAYIGGSLGTLIGADLSNLRDVQGIGAPIASIGGAGTFDGVFLVGVMAAFVAGFSGGRPWASPRQDQRC
jgi:uncharacterized membrane protein